MQSSIYLEILHILQREVELRGMTYDCERANASSSDPSILLPYARENGSHVIVDALSVACA